MTIGPRAANLIAALLCLLFVVSGSLFIEKPGIQTDEALFTAGSFHPLDPGTPAARVFGRDYALMVMTYVGAFKSLLYIPIFDHFGASPFVIRFPALLIGAVSVWWFYRLLLLTLGQRSALVGCALLATHSTYLLTVRWDWGPVALQHALLTGGLLGFASYANTRRLLHAAAGAFAFGLGMWDKALFAWSLAALGVAVLAVFPRQVRVGLTLRATVVATLAFSAGAYPLIRYNVKHDWVTFRTNARPNQDPLSYKLAVLQDTLNGKATGSAILREHWDGPERPLETSGERLIVRIASWTGQTTRNWHEWLLALALLALPFVWRTPARKATIFALIFCALTWAQMAAVQEGGTSIHHTILLWPVALIPPAAVLGHVRLPVWAPILITAVICAQSMLTTVVWYSKLLRFGGAPAWTDAIYPAAEQLGRHEGYVCIIDWGFFDNLRVLSLGRIRLCVAEDPSTPQSEEYALASIHNPEAVFITHPEEHEIQPGRTARFVAFAESKGYRKTDVRQFRDSNGRITIKTFRFERSGSSPEPSNTGQ